MRTRTRRCRTGSLRRNSIEPAAAEAHALRPAADGPTGAVRAVSRTCSTCSAAAARRAWRTCGGMRPPAENPWAHLDGDGGTGDDDILTSTGRPAGIIRSVLFICLSETRSRFYTPIFCHACAAGSLFCTWTTAR